jgi:hypothetical protein
MLRSFFGRSWKGMTPEARAKETARKVTAGIGRGKGQNKRDSEEGHGWDR